MTVAQLLAFNAILIVSILSPGAAFLMAVRASVSGGRRAGLATGLGLATMASLWTLAALLGMDALFAIAPWLFGVLKVGGALYLLYLAVQTWRGATRPVTDNHKRSGRAFLDGFLVNLGNPKSILFAAAVLVVVLPADLPAWAIVTVTLDHFVLEVLFYSACALALSAPLARAQYLRAKPLLDRTAALLMGGFGLKLLLQR